MILHIAAVDPLLHLVGGHPLLAANIGGRAACPQPEYDFWVVQQDGEAVGFLCRTGETLYATATAEQSDEVAQFAAAVGFRRLITDLDLPFEVDRPLLAMEHGGNMPPQIVDKSICRQLVPRHGRGLSARKLAQRAVGNPKRFPPHTPPSLGSVHFFTETSSQFSVVAFAELQRLSRTLATDEETQRYAVSLSHQIRNGSSAAVTIKLDGQVTAGAALCHRYHGTVVLGAVAVLPQYRGQGLGRTIALTACHLATHWGDVPLLCCKPSLEHLYSSIGFVPSLPIYCYTPHGKEKQDK